MKTEQRGFMHWWRGFMIDFHVGMPITCPDCKGSGYIRTSEEPVYDDDPYCSMSGCGGGGSVSYPSRKCPTCGGSRQVLQTLEGYLETLDAKKRRKRR